jgi:predicted ribosomally synthesized peptide with nif11-like leader
MSQLEALKAHCTADSTFSEKFMAAEDVITAVSIAKEAGFEVTAEELQSLAGDEGDEERELTDEELSAASGGSGFWAALKKKLVWAAAERHEQMVGAGGGQWSGSKWKW